ncbi:plasmodesmata-located protein 3-like [Arachis stenosperma]|uniref:plasmodesmata-located protein 3-like n=1 Tax=Arachis stenosperma TaxID=217475 RepID=UPI0025AD36C0|nr:plasmodesmata-located protein 3-like [Arachis stenosperma]
MDLSHSTIFIILFLTFLLLPFSSRSSSHYSTLVYKTCSNRTSFNNNNNQLLLSSRSYSQTLTSLFNQLIAQSSQSKFFRTKELALDESAVISGLFQCREDIAIEDCFSCVNSLPPYISSNTLCTGSTSARVQLQGCHIQYNTENLSAETTNGDETEGRNNGNNIIIHKECGEPISDNETYFKFRELMENAFVALENEIAKSEDRFCRSSYEWVELMAQCEGDSDTCECNECVSDAVRFAKEECSASISVRIYLDKCFISYSYHLGSYENPEIPTNSLPGSRSNSHNTPKLAAIVAGGAAVLFLGFIFISLLNSRLKKNDYE